MIIPKWIVCDEAVYTRMPTPDQSQSWRSICFCDSNWTSVDKSDKSVSIYGRREMCYARLNHRRSRETRIVWFSRLTSVTIWPPQAIPHYSIVRLSFPSINFLRVHMTVWWPSGEVVGCSIGTGKAVQRGNWMIQNPRRHFWPQV